jgi:hypothetical protein
MKINLFRFLTTLLIPVAVSFTACVDNDVDNPPPDGANPDIEATMTIDSLKNMFRDTIIDDNAIVTITTDEVITGIVTADDQTGNFYKTVVIQDETAGIAIRVDMSDFYTRFPVGRRVFVKLKGLVMGDYANLLQLGGYIDTSDPTEPEVAPIPMSLIDTYILRGEYNLTVVPEVATIDDLNADPDYYQNRLIMIEDVEFVDADTGKAYADAILQESVNLNIKNCDGDVILLRSSGFASFASQNVPDGNGNLTAIFSVFDTDAQLIIRDLDDVALDSIRCDGSVPGQVLTSLNQNFTSQVPPASITIGGWVNDALQGTELWESRSFSGNVFANASAFGTSGSMEAWLITPELDLSVADTLTFESAWGFYVHQGLTVWISTDFDGTNVAAATWTQLNPILAVASTPASGSYSDWVPSGNVSLTAFSGTGFIAFKYVGDASTNTTTWRVDNVIVH